MTVTNTDNKDIYSGDGATLIFAYTYKIFLESDLVITIADTSVTPQTEILLVLNTDYTVSGVGNPSGGNITLLLTGQLSVAPSATDEITILRTEPLTQNLDYIENDDFPSQSTEDAMDKLTFITQQLQEQLSRAVLLAVNITGVDLTLPTPEADAPIGWNATATGLTNNPAEANLSQIDASATPDYIGATAGDGVIRVGANLSYVDGGDFVTIDVIGTPSVSTIVIATSLTLNGYLVNAILDEDTLVSDSATALATQQSIKAYVDAQITSQNEFIELTDTPASFAGQTLLFPRVNAGETALEFVAVTQNATHTGEVTGSTTLTVDPTAITNKSGATVAGGDLVLIADIDDSNNLKQVTAQSIADLGAGGGAIEVLDEGSSLSAAISSIDFVGAGVVATNIGSAITVTIAGGGGGGATLTEDVNQTTHGFTVGQWVYNNGTIYALADASAATTAESIGVVSAVAGANDFTIQFGGKITGLSGLTKGEAHFLSETAGLITATAPTTSGAITKPVLIADSTTSGFIFNMRGSANTDSTSFTASFVDADLTAGVLTISHNLGRKYVQVQIFDNSDQLIQPDDITLTDGNTVTVDLSSFGTLTGTYNYVIMDSGATVNLDIPTYTQTFVDADLTAGVIAITHNLSDQYPVVQIYDNSNNVIIPDEITATSTSVTTLDLSGFGTLVGTYRVVVSATGGTAAASPTNVSFNQSFVNADLAASILTVTHNLGVLYNQVIIYNNLGEVAVPDDITATSINVTTLDFTSFGTLTGTWNVLILSAGAVQSSTATDLNLTGQVAEDLPFFDGVNWLPKGGVEKIKVDTFDRDTAVASGTQVITGVGFKPSYIVLNAGQNGTTKYSMGYDDGTTKFCWHNQGASGTVWERAAELVRVDTTGVNYYHGHIQSFDSDGFTIVWTKTGSPTGTATCHFTCYR